MDSQREPQFHPEDRRTPMSLADFAQQNQITEERVWELIEEGTIAARFVNDSILILRDSEPGFETPYELPEIDVRAQSVPAHAQEAAVPPPLAPTFPHKEKDREKEKEPRLDHSPAVPPREKEPERVIEPAETFPPNFSSSDHAETADSSHELLLFARDALARNEELSRQLLAAKDELIQMKDEKITWLSQLIQQKDREIRSLNRQVEDLVTLKKFERT